MSFPTPQIASPLDPREIEKLDVPLIALTNACGGDLRKLLFAFFSFLQRRTDFYLVPHDSDLKEGKATMGFREGDAETMLLAAFRQFPLRRIPSRLAATNKAKSASAAAEPTTQVLAMQPSSKKETTSSSSSVSSVPTVSTTETTPKSSQVKSAATESTARAETSVIPSTVEMNSEKTQSASIQSSKAKESTVASVIRYSEDSPNLQVPVGNGGTTKRYTWTQTIDECTVMLGVHEGCRGKDLDVKIKSNHISVRSKAPLAPGEEPKLYLEGALSGSVVPAESTWSLESNVLIIILFKQAKTFWKTIIQGDEEIDTSLVDSRRRIDEYDQQTQAQIRKIMFDQEQVRKGLPTSDELTGARPQIPTIPSDMPGDVSGDNTSKIPPLPPGVEYIDQKKLQEVQQAKK